MNFVTLGTTIMKNKLIALLCLIFSSQGIAQNNENGWTFNDYISFHQKVINIDSTESFLLPSLSNEDSVDFIAFVDTSNFHMFLSRYSSTEDKLRKMMELFQVIGEASGKYYLSGKQDENWRIALFTLFYERMVLDLLSEEEKSKDMLNIVVEGGGIYTSMNAVITMIKNSRTSYPEEELLLKIRSISLVFGQLHERYITKEQNDQLDKSIKSLLSVVRDSNILSSEIKNLTK